jgi:hypothetical protein
MTAHVAVTKKGNRHLGRHTNTVLTMNNEPDHIRNPPSEL